MPVTLLIPASIAVLSLRCALQGPDYHAGQMAARMYGVAGRWTQLHSIGLRLREEAMNLRGRDFESFVQIQLLRISQDISIYIY